MKGLLLLAAGGTIALSLDASKWTALAFSSCPANTIRHEGGQLRIGVDASSSPLVWIAERPETWRKVVVRGQVEGHLDLPPGGPWAEGSDDAWLRVNVIEAGGRRLNATQRLVAPEWMKWLDGRVGIAGKGVTGMRSFLLTPKVDHPGESRQRPDAELIRETLHSSPGVDGSFTMEIVLDPPVEAAGLWLQADGDDTGASFEVRIDEIVIDSR